MARTQPPSSTENAPSTRQVSDADATGWRGNVRGVTRIGAKAGLLAWLVLALLAGLIVYGIATSGHRRAPTAAAPALTKASEQQRPWWNAVPDGIRVPPVAQPVGPQTPQVPPLSPEQPPTIAQVPNIAPIAQAQVQEAQAVELRAAQRQALRDAAAAAPITVRLNDNAEPSRPDTQGLATTTLAAPISSPTISLPATNPGELPSSTPATAESASPDQLIATRRADATPFTLLAGSVIPATLVTGINADLPGTIVAQVRDDVFDSTTGHFLLIPRGTRVIGAYDNRIVQGQRRVLVAWTRLLFPDGSSIDLPGMGGTDPAGYAGLGANVDEHLNKTFGSALLLSIIGAGAQLSQPQRSATFGEVPDIGQTIAGAIGQQIGNTSIQLTQRQLQIPPTLTVPPGYQFDVLVSRDVVLAAPYANAESP